MNYDANYDKIRLNIQNKYRDTKKIIKMTKEQLKSSLNLKTTYLNKTTKI